MTRLFWVVICFVALVSCKNGTQPGGFTITGELKNVPDQKIYLDELYFSQKEPSVLDTAEITNGKFNVNALATEPGLYRLRLENSEVAFVLINDQPAIGFKADYNNLSLQTTLFSSPANELLRKFMLAVSEQRKALDERSTALQQFTRTPETDSAYKVMQHEYDAQLAAHQNYLIHYVDTTTNPIMAMFSIGYTRDIDPDKLEKPVNGLSKRFPGNQAIASLAAQYQQMITQFKAKPHIGGAAPELNMADTSGKPFALSMLKGKYVLVDFWASWCGPCRAENPNVVKVYNAYKDKNFTVLGVSLDDNKEAWIKAILDDRLAWYHISDLKQWGSEAVKLYGFDGIPYNVLLDPAGKIIATNLRGPALALKLAEVIK